MSDTFEFSWRKQFSQYVQFYMLHFELVEICIHFRDSYFLLFIEMINT